MTVAVRRLYFGAIVAAAIAAFSIFARYPISFYVLTALNHLVRQKSIRQDISWTPHLHDFKATSISKQPNILLIIADDLGSNDLDNGAGVATPNIMSIAQNGINFRRGYAGHGTCAPSRAAIMTGRYATRFGFEFTPVPTLLADFVAVPKPHSVRKALLHTSIYPEIPNMGDMIVPLTEDFIPKHLKPLGYRSYHFGKWHLGEAKNATPYGKGFDEALSFLAGASLYLPRDHPDVVNAPVNNSLDDFLWWNLDFIVQHNDGPHIKPDKYMTEYLTEQCRSALHAHSKELNVPGKSRVPFFVTMAFNAVHNPLQALRSDYDDPRVSHLTNHVERVYAAMVLNLDNMVGEIVETLKEIGEYENTLIIFTSDNGAAHYLGMEHLNKPFRGWKATLFEGGIRVPFFMQWLDQLPKGVVVDEPVGHVDIFSTIVGAGKSGFDGAYESPVGNPVDGKNIISYVPKQVSVVQKNLTVENIHETLYWRSGHYRAFLYKGYKLQVSFKPRKLWLFDMSVDETERTNLLQGNQFWYDIVFACNDHHKDYLLKQRESIYLTSYVHHMLHKNITFKDSYRPLRKCRITLTRDKTPLDDLMHEIFDKLCEIDSEQSCPLWPAAVEVPVPIDHSREVASESDDYIYWAN